MQEPRGRTGRLRAGQYSKNYCGVLGGRGSRELYLRHFGEPGGGLKTREDGGVV